MARDKFGIECDNLEVDHIYPLSKGGSNHKKNKQMLCRLSNELKADKTRGSINGHRFSVKHAGRDENDRIIGAMEVNKK